MIALEQAREAVIAACPPLTPREVIIADAIGCVVADEVVAAVGVPAFANSAMDGFAVRASDVAGATADAPVDLAVIAEAAAGVVGEHPVGPGEAVRIMTGAPMPAGADAVVPVEATTEVAGGARAGGRVNIGLERNPGDSVRAAAEDVAFGERVLVPGTVVTPALVGVLASVGRATVPVVPHPQVGVLSTGDELVAPGRGLAPGQVHDSGRPSLLGLVAGAGAEAVDLGHAADDADRLAATLDHAAGRCDLVVTIGGVSMGDFDVVAEVLGRRAAMEWMQVAIKPAKPFALGAWDGTPVLGLPGNPVSALVSFELLARPGLRNRGGHTRLDRPRVLATATADLARRPDGKLHLPRVRVTLEPGGFAAQPVPAQGSHQLAATAGATGLALVPDGDGIAAGDPVEVIVLDPDAALRPA